MTKKHYFYFVISLIVLLSWIPKAESMIVPEDIVSISTVTDTIPIKERKGNFINDPKVNPFDITPNVIDQKVEFEPETGNYIIFEKIGDEYYRTPNYMTFQEYLEWKSKYDEQRYFKRLAGVHTGRKSKLGKLDPISKIDIQKSLIDRLFGGTDITITPEGSIDLILGFKYNKNDNPFIPPSSQKNGPLLDFDMDIRMSVDGNIGDKIKLGFNYDTQATFDFDKKMKLEYDSEQFSEDDIIKKIEAGNVSFPLRSTLIQGVESLFGLKTDLQFGHLKISAIAAEQRSKQKSLTVKNGAVEQEFEIRPDEYDELRHFFLSHYHRARFEDALSNLPQIKGIMDISELEVWVTTTGNDVSLIEHKIVGFADLAEGDLGKFDGKTSRFPPITNPKYDEGIVLPYNGVNSLYKTLLNDEVVRRSDETSARLNSSIYGMDEQVDFEIFTGKKLKRSEYTYNSKLGTVSLNQRLRSNQTLAVAYTYTYKGKVYHVGDPIVGSITSDQDTMNSPLPTNVKYMKMLKSSNQSINRPSWDLMMKNVYSIGTAQLNQEGFQFDVFYEDNSNGSLVRFIPEDNFRLTQLLEVFGLDKLNTRLDPQQDGVFDFVPGITVIPRTGTIIFPKVEPFGSSLKELFKSDTITANKYTYQELYELSKTSAKDSLHKNRFVMKGKFKSDFSTDISLGAFNVPAGSVTVTAGGVPLIEGVDYEINYGLGQVKIINTSYLSSGQPINIRFEDSAVFSQQKKTMLGLRAEYEINKHMNIGGTYLRLFEKPYSTKVNLGDDPINNRVFGLDFNYGDEAPFITRMLDKLPFYSTKAASNINFSTEFAALKPGHSSAIDLSETDGGLVSIDDFEGASSKISLSGFGINNWVLASTPTKDFPEGELSDSLPYGANRALLNWYGSYNRVGATGTDDVDFYLRALKQKDIFDREIVNTDINGHNLYTMSMSYYPRERGPYNYDIPGGYAGVSAGIESVDDNGKVYLNNPETRWGGIMRSFQNTDFEALNVEYIEFWMLNPFSERLDGVEGAGADEIGELVFNLGNVSEDVLKDGLQFYENSLSTGPTNIVPSSQTIWGNVPIVSPISRGFDKTNQTEQDLGFDGLNLDGEIDYFQGYLNKMLLAFPNAQGLYDDPANDDYVSVTDPEVSGENSLLKKYKNWNGPEGNSDRKNAGQNSTIPGNPQADAEDLNKNKSLEQGESYYQYRVELRNEGNELGNHDWITETRIVERDSVTAQGKEIWYRFRIPLKVENTNRTIVNGIEGFRSIQFIRMYMKGFKTPTILRFAELELVRNSWRSNKIKCETSINPNPDFAPSFSFDEVSKFDNGNKKPFPYVIPRGVKTERLYSSGGAVNQDEKSLALNFCNMGKDCEVSVFKLSTMDLRQFERLQLFVHGELDSLASEIDTLTNGGYSVFVKLGKDFRENYYEYEIPIVMSDLADAGSTKSDAIWRPENMLDFSLKLFTELKKIKNSGGSLSMPDPESQYGGKVSMKGNPSLGYIKGIQIGVRKNIGVNDSHCGQVWVNELRASGFKEKGGVAATAKLDMQLADLGTFSAIANYSSVGWGAIDKKLNERQKEEIIDYSLATNLQLGKLLPKKAKLSIPFYAQYSQTLSTPQYDPYDLDLTVDEKLESATTDDEKDEIIDRAQDKTTIKTISFTNVKREKSGSGTAKPWSLSNFSISYSYSKMEHTDPLVRIDRTTDERGSLNYTYARKAKYIKPFKFIKAKSLKFISGINFNLLPSSFTISNNLTRYHSRKEYRLPLDIDFVFDDNRFDWNRKYQLKWNFMKDLKFTFNAENKAVIDELRQVGIRASANDRDWVNERGDTSVVSGGARYEESDVENYWKDNFKKFGRNKSYNHRVKLDYTLPLKNTFLKFITVKAGYQSTYNWDASALNIDYLGNVVSNSQARNIAGNINFEKLYRKSKYLKKIQKASKKKSTKDKKENKNNRKKKKGKSGKDKKGKKGKKESREPSLAERILIRPLLLMRSIKLNYKEDLGTTIPGIRSDFEPSYFGLADNFTVPGWEFVAGLQPNLNSFYQEKRTNKWIARSNELNQNTLQKERQSIEAKVAIEPIKSFKINLIFKKSYEKNHSRLFTDIGENGVIDYSSNTEIDQGSFETTYFTMNTLFGGKAFSIQDNKDRINRIFDNFKANRQIISNRRGGGNVVINHPDNPNYAFGYGDVSNEVLVPAFLAAYEGKNANDISLDIASDIAKKSYIPAPSWTVKYDGLAKLRWFKKFFKTFTLSHGYKSTLKVSDFRTNLDFSNEFSGLLNPINKNYYSQFEIPTLRIQETFNPIIGVDIQTMNGMKLKFEYSKRRDLTLETTTKRLQEGNTAELVFGFGYVVKGLDIPFLTGSKKKKKKKKKGARSLLDKRNDKEEDDKSKNGGKKKKKKKKVSDSRGNDMTISLDFAIRDDVRYVHDLSLGEARADRGAKTISLKPNIEYDIHKNLSLVMYFDYNKTIPYLSSSYTQTNMKGGFKVRFKLN